MSALFQYTSFPDEPAEFQSRDDELAQLRAAAAEAQAAHVYLDESYVNDPSDPPLDLAERCARMVNAIAEQARQLAWERQRVAELENTIVEQALQISALEAKPEE